MTDYAPARQLLASLLPPALRSATLSACSNDSLRTASYAYPRMPLLTTATLARQPHCESIVRMTPL